MFFIGQCMVSRFLNCVMGVVRSSGAKSLIVIELKQQFLDTTCAVAAAQHVARGVPAQLHAGAVEPVGCLGRVAEDPPGKF
jgi:hypothetical protein